MSINDRDLSALEHLAYRIREDTPGCKTWDREGCHVVFARELKGKHLLTALEIVTRHAADPEAKTPGSITRKFLPETTKPAATTEKCPDHIGQPPPPFCAIHAQEPVKAYYDEPVERVPQDTARELARQAASEAARAAAAKTSQPTRQGSTEGDQAALSVAPPSDEEGIA
jgi:hypothetical protein